MSHSHLHMHDNLHMQRTCTTCTDLAPPGAPELGQGQPIEMRGVGLPIDLRASRFLQLIIEISGLSEDDDDWIAGAFEVARDLFAQVVAQSVDEYRHHLCSRQVDQPSNSGLSGQEAVRVVAFVAGALGVDADRAPAG